MTIKHIIFFFGIIGLVGCDMFTTDNTRLVGDIFLVNPHNQDVNGYRMIIHEGNINSNILEEDVINVQGNDTLLFAKCKNENADFIYYKINHSKGQQLIKAVSISSREYLQLKETIKTKYSFTAE